MRATSLLRWAALVAILCSTVRLRSQSSQETKPRATAAHYLITGTVINNVDQSPVPHCKLTAAPFARRGNNGRQFRGDLDSVDCDEHGHFSVTLPSAGAWRLSASARGFVTQAYEEHETFSTAIVVSPAKPTMEVQFRISPEAVITGVVLDEAGEPVRNAMVSLQTAPAVGPDGNRAQGGIRSTDRTDDRGIYEMAKIAPGSYRILVQAQPWYAANLPRRPDNAAAVVDPSLDFAYPLTWFPGTDNPTLAETINLQAGETRQADFRLNPVPSAHIRISIPLAPGPPGTPRPIGAIPMVQPVVPGLSNPPMSGPVIGGVRVQSDNQFQIDFSGLAPGTYRVATMGNGGEQGRSSSIIEVTAGAVRTLDPDAHPNGAKVTLQFDGIGKGDSDSRQVEVNLLDATTGVASSSFTPMGGGPGNFSRGGGRRERSTERTMEVPAGRYEVVLQGRPDLYLTGVTAKGAEAAGRFVILPAGASTLTLHVASGRASVTGVASFQGKPSVGAMVLLVPTTIEDANSLRILRRDQTNTDGAFDLTDIIPGQYILVVIDHGWQINWGDPLTLRGYLTQGVALDLASGANVKQNIEAEAP